MAAKINKTVRIPLASGSKSSGKTVPGPGSVRGGGTLAGGLSSGGQNTGGGGYGRTTGLQKKSGRGR